MHTKIQQDTVGGWYLCYIFLCVTANLLIDTYGPVFSLFCQFLGSGQSQDPTKICQILFYKMLKNKCTK